MSSTVGELRRAWAALDAGQFAGAHEPQRRGNVWTPAPAERVLTVVGAHGMAGATTLALAIATVSAPARVVECAPTSKSGLVGAATAELGSRDGWLRGTRDDVVLERSDDVTSTPIPLSSDLATTVVDVGCRFPDRSDVPWMTSTLDAAGLIVIVGDCSLHGIQRIQQTLPMMVGRSCVVAVRGSKPHQAPRIVRQALGELDSPKPLIHIPDDRRIRVRGIDTSPLPSSLLVAAERILTEAYQAWRKEAS